VDFDPRLLAAALEPFPHAGDPPPGLAGYRSHYALDLPPGVRHEIGRVDVRGEDVVVQRFVPPGARGSLVCVHGLFDHAALWRHQLRWGLARGLCVVLLDLPGHGLSAGERAHVESFEHYVDALEAALSSVKHQLPRPVLGIGQSTGCSVLMQAVLDAARTEVAFDDLVLLAPLVRPAGDRLGRPLLPVLSVLPWLPRLAWGNTSDAAYNRFQREQDPLQARSLPLSWVRAMASWSEAFDALPENDLSPLVVQGTADRVVAWRGNLRRIAERFSDPEVVLLEGARHNLMNELPAHRARIEAALDARLQRLLEGEAMAPDSD
jgi:alpha-beta hydrolase superfamily lysophospholipase